MHLLVVNDCCRLDLVFGGTLAQVERPDSRICESDAIVDRTQTPL